jgi:hypothetical protein
MKVRISMVLKKAIERIVRENPDLYSSVDDFLLAALREELRRSR